MRNDHVKMKMPKKPLSPCQACGSPEHWNKECPDWDFFLTLQQKLAHVGEAVGTDDLTEQAYQASYQILLSERLASLDKPDFESATQEVSQREKATECKTETVKLEEGKKVSKVSKKVTVEEVEKEDNLLQNNFPPAWNFILEEVEQQMETGEVREMYHSSTEACLIFDWQEYPPPPLESTPFVLCAKRKHPPGLSAQRCPYYL
ncbi:uncharacterized protein EV420DRAFT_1485287 [Desarmillaria tabescens]|uniref:CCHC-type domain-containing protein n=1 Tax=Armillaria tabescens TaxID=1929756 RepID=A0AA39MQP8_ARMTA|nr:uncharacterized protein EV420DRAFT_1485287 [Desarmillaria tabescens]KAK0442743.1 hypothetical protein EV420DRAFT_1485287 [Desarmillaria tabescens]